MRLLKDVIPVLLVGSMSDEAQDREVSLQEGEGFAQESGCRFFETSAKTA